MSQLSNSDNHPLLPVLKCINKNIKPLTSVIFLLQFQVSNKLISNKTSVTEQYNKQCVAESYVAKSINQINHINYIKE